ncbi:MAG: hypothetical protein V4649_08015 [Bacteroidota bacterium]
METNKDKWIEEVLGSTQGMAKADAPAALYDTVMEALSRPRAVRGITLPVKQWAVAAVLLIAVNIASVVYFSTHSRPAGGDDDMMVAQMVSESTYNY